MAVEELLAQLGGTAGAVVALAIWTNSKFNKLSIDIAYLKGKGGIDL